jgi:hypothetical protein
MKKLFNDKRWEPIFMLLGNIAVFDWLIFPGLTVPSTFINMLTVLGFIALFLFDINYVKERYFTVSEEEKQLQAEWAEKLSKEEKKVAKKVKIKIKK